jgi:thiosulfate dehydrogenase [quinone] large subunit
MATLPVGVRGPGRHAAAEFSTVREHDIGEVLWGLARIAIGFIFLWAFLDKLFGLGRSTPSAKSWINGGSPTSGYLSGVDGPLKGFFNAMAGHAWVDWLFMIGIGGLGIALMLGIGMWIAAIGGTVLLLMMWLSALPISANPFIDDHIVYALVILAVAFSGEGLRYGLGHWWRARPVVQRLRWLK